MPSFRGTARDRNVLGDYQVADTIYLILTLLFEPVHFRLHLHIVTHR